MRIGRGRLWAAALAAGALLAAGLWATSGKPPRLPNDPDHSLGQAEAHCLTCHAFRAKHPRPADHPLRDDCFSCHRDPAGTLHPRPGAPTELTGGWRDDPRLAGRLRGGSDAGGTKTGSPGRP